MNHHVLYDAAKQEAIGIKILVYHYETFSPFLFMYLTGRQTKISSNGLPPNACNGWVWTGVMKECNSSPPSVAGTQLVRAPSASSQGVQ